MRSTARHDATTSTIIANMERWRWMPRDLGKAYVMLNIPDFTLRSSTTAPRLEDPRRGRQAGTPTPILSAKIKYIMVNPTWHVPQSIVYGEYLPALEQDPGVLARMGLRVAQTRRPLHISQPPGERNALGRIKFNFPNRFQVYQHDTPDKHLFAHDEARLQPRLHAGAEPGKYGEVLLDRASAGGLHAERLKSMFGGASRQRLQDADSGAPHLPDRVCRRRRQAGGARGHLRPRRARAGGAEGRIAGAAEIPMRGRSRTTAGPLGAAADRRRAATATGGRRSPSSPAVR